MTEDLTAKEVNVKTESCSSGADNAIGYAYSSGERASGEGTSSRAACDVSLSNLSYRKIISGNGYQVDSEQQTKKQSASICNIRQGSKRSGRTADKTYLAQCWLSFR
ncbi:hypothetical protein ETR_02189 [Erwinia tracheiphila PSU-1]|uniref:Uncharacterized protein n=1 Tax=Erwinia tracheiphila TaxID=65700 RepID=A0A345CRY4_9GAMM|nr:hypothetical protein AV903_09330 [Erwinia tracheiphila]EOS96551.1 hypothetical protein ETR_02189 [Erwinia tracheiphila PSU-1]